MTGQAPEAAVRGVARSQVMADTLAFIVKNARTAGGDHQINKALADFDFDSQRRLGRTRMLVRAGPALGLMGTLIPLSPALTGLANGNTAALSENLRVAFSVTVVGPAGRCGRVRDLAFARPHVRAGPLRPRVRRGDHQRPAPLALGDPGNGHDGEHRQAGTAVADPSPTEDSNDLGHTPRPKP